LEQFCAAHFKTVWFMQTAGCISGVKPLSLLSKLQETWTTNRRHGSGRLKCAHAEVNVAAVEEPTLSQEGWPQKHTIQNARYRDKSVSPSLLLRWPYTAILV